MRDVASPRDQELAGRGRGVQRRAGAQRLGKVTARQLERGLWYSKYLIELFSRPQHVPMPIP